MNKIKSNFLPLVLLFAIIFSATSFPSFSYAASLSGVSDTMSTQAPNVTADHTIAWTQATGHATTAGDTIAIAFTTSGDFTANAAGTWQTSDFALTDTNHTAKAPLAVGVSPACTATDNYTVTISGTALPVFTITLCSSWVTSTTGTAVTFKIFGTAGTGAGTLTNRNGDVNSSPFTITDTGSNTDTGTGSDVIETNDVVTINATVNPTLTFAISSNTISLGTLSSGGTASSSHTISVASNGLGGFAVTYNGPTLTNAASGTQVIAAYSSLSTSAAGTAGFGINLRSNSSPAVGADPVTNAGTCGVATNYNTTNRFTWVASTPTAITNVTGPADCVYTVSYIANISTVTPAGSYTSATTYVATGTF